MAYSLQIVARLKRKRGISYTWSVVLIATEPLFGKDKLLAQERIARQLSAALILLYHVLNGVGLCHGVMLLLLFSWACLFLSCHPYCMAYLYTSIVSHSEYYMILFYVICILSNNVFCACTKIKHLTDHSFCFLCDKCFSDV